MKSLSEWLERTKGGKKPRKQLRKVSKKRAPIQKEYLKKRKAYLAANPYCEALALHGLYVCEIKSCDVHHIAGRRGGNLLNEDTWLPVCRPCHDFIHSHPKESKEMGWLK